ncbi:DUF1349 domain-containing protein [Gemmata sp. JC673]|uniref:DUF1349 domain-containing protein n=1 Tax=Gemmata algarum TaxID=2975278 RepID=A0ABU5F7F0_9BACT|nr:hypothetical protein [Gemmata algarum]MDY3562650.1 DUF1349 domain-containing protein [Gemmata algarum]
MMRAFLLATVGASTWAVAAPVPPPSEKELIAKHWGKPEGEGQFELKGKQLTLRATGDGPADMRVTRTVRGDFTARVTLADVATPAKGDARQPHSHAGLSIKGGGYSLSHYLLQLYNHDNNGELYDTPQRSVWTDRFIDAQGGGGTSLKEVEQGQTVYFEVTRKDKTVTVSYSFDGKDWAAPQAFGEKLDFPDEVTVSVYLSHCTCQKLHATFDGFTITPLKK